MQLPTHLGDGAYLDHDGYQFWLAANDHRNRVISLDPGAYEAFLKRSAPIAAARMFGADKLAFILEELAASLRRSDDPGSDEDFDVLED